MEIGKKESKTDLIPSFIICQIKSKSYDVLILEGLNWIEGIHSMRREAEWGNKTSDAVAIYEWSSHYKKLLWTLFIERR